MARKYKASEEEKLDIEDIKGPGDENLDFEEAVSEEIEQKKEETQETEITSSSKTKSYQSPLKKPQNSSKFSIKILLLVLTTALLTTAVVLGVVYYYLNSQQKNEPKTESAAPQTEVTETTQAGNENYVYVTEFLGLNLREEPNTSGKIITVMPRGSKLKVIDEQDDWIKVDYNGKIGWCAKQFTSEKNPLIYQNEEYDFEITFPESWSDYKVFKENIIGSEATFYFALPTKDAGWLDSTIEKGYASLFTVSVYTKDQWQKVISSDDPKPQKLIEKDDYVYGWTQAQAAPSDLTTAINSSSNILKTFKVN